MAATQKVIVMYRNQTGWEAAIEEGSGFTKTTDGVTTIHGVRPGETSNVQLGAVANEVLGSVQFVDAEAA
ncbi:MAG: hypothetical protein H0U46_01685 [Actinobacteria bacterium]|nr:hypothetical protein [Actinomycetota bacterium]